MSNGVRHVRDARAAAAADREQSTQDADLLLFDDLLDDTELLLFGADNEGAAELVGENASDNCISSAWSRSHPAPIGTSVPLDTLPLRPLRATTTSDLLPVVTPCSAPPNSSEQTLRGGRKRVKDELEGLRSLATCLEQHLQRLTLDKQRAASTLVRAAPISARCLHSETLDSASHARRDRLMYARSLFVCLCISRSSRRLSHSGSA